MERYWRGSPTTPGYEEWRLHHINNPLPLPKYETLQIPIEEPPSEIKLLRREFEQEKTSFATEISRLKKEKGQLEMNIYLRSDEMDQVVKEWDYFKDDLEILTRIM